MTLALKSVAHTALAPDGRTTLLVAYPDGACELWWSTYRLCSGAISCAGLEDTGGSLAASGTSNRVDILTAPCAHGGFGDETARTARQVEPDEAQD